MVAIADPERTLDLTALAAGMGKALPTYARPLFVRLLGAGMDITGTYRMKKVDYQREGFDPARVRDPVYFWDAARQSYVPLTPAIHQQILDAKLKL